MSDARQEAYDNHRVWLDRCMDYGQEVVDAVCEMTTGTDTLDDHTRVAQERAAYWSGVAQAAHETLCDRDGLCPGCDQPLLEPGSGVCPRCRVSPS